MIGAALTEHTKHGFFMNWVGGAPAGAEGFEYHLLTLGMSLPLLITGAGALSVDRWLASRSPATRTVLDPQPV
jgi:putative oxidoreductase